MIIKILKKIWIGFKLKIKGFVLEFGSSCMNDKQYNDETREFDNINKPLRQMTF